MKTSSSPNTFPTGAEQGSQAWQGFWEDESWPVTPGTRIVSERDLGPVPKETQTSGHVITAAGTLSVEEWFNSFTPDADAAQLY
jgi:hypothetical protein